MLIRTVLFIAVVLLTTTLAVGQVDPPRLDPAPSTGQAGRQQDAVGGFPRLVKIIQMAGDGLID